MKKYLFILLFPSCMAVQTRVPLDNYLQTAKSHLTLGHDAPAPEDSFRMVEVNQAGFTELMRKSDEALVILWSDWSDSLLTELPTLVEQAETRNIIFISSDRCVKRVKKEFARMNFNKAIYVTSSTVFEANKTAKKASLQDKLFGKKDVVPAVFKRLMYFKNGKYVGDHTETTSPSDSLLIEEQR